MKRYYAAPLLAIVLLLSGCFKQDYSDCTTPDNLVLKLDLKDDSGESRFSQNINSIYAVVYDTGNRYVAHAEVAKNALNQFAGVTFSVEPGDYRVVCWGNIDGNTAVRDMELGFAESYLETVSGATGSALYYAPKKEPAERDTPITRSGDTDYSSYTVNVPAGRVTTHDVEFGRAHRKVKVYLKGYHTEHEAAVPTVKINNQPLKTDFFLRTDESRRSYQSQPVPVTVQEGNMIASSFCMPVAPLTNEMTVEVVRASDSEIVASVDLKQYVEDNSGKIDDIYEFGVLIYFTLNGHVEVSVPGWSGGSLTPGW